MRHHTAIAAAEDYFYRKRVLGFAVSLGIGTFPFPRKGEVGLDRAIELLNAGWNVLIFPEGVRSQSGHMKPFKPGIGMIGSRLQLPIVPVRIDGADRVLHPSWKWPKPGPVSVTFGTPMRLSGDNYADLAKQVEQAVRDLPIAPAK